ncbi:leukocyte elastase inhibitor-like [Ricinus communis]|uniref:leukocyte elastase inhibitor-like n=1 Tax=Ricinus communis TaxID=3988 RepID=UPI00077218A7|nr:leukocyte elastase inhibitor-like [Ricinus communis]|eukprot:XP_015573579.1 leukocyte elastase inhibitor-like [Ricinus communis]
MAPSNERPLIIPHLNDSTILCQPTCHLKKRTTALKEGMMEVHSTIGKEIGLIEGHPNVFTIMQSNMDLDLGSLGEQVREEVNLWAEKATKGLIKELVPPGGFRNYTTLVLANALHRKLASCF